MAFFGTPERSDANPPETWEVVKVAERRWHVRTAEGATLDGYDTRAAAIADIGPDGRLRRAYEAERRWFAGETPAGMRSWAECEAEARRAFAGR